VGIWFTLAAIHGLGDVTDTSPLANRPKFLEQMIMTLNRSEQMTLMRFVCNAAWGDVEIQDEERQHILKLGEKLGLVEADITQVKQWLKSPPPIDSVDPTAIPARHRDLFIKEMEAIIAADGVVTEDEGELLSLMKDLLVWEEE